MKYFSLDEFDCPSLPLSGKEMQPSFLEMLEKARDYAGIPFVITSGYRTKFHNDSLPNSVPDSAHTKGYAVDIAIKGSLQRYTILQALLRAGFSRIGIAKTFIHVDSDPDKSPQVIWTYN